MANIGKVTVTSPVRTVIADPKFKPKPNVALSELTDTNITSPQTGDIVTWDSTLQKFVVKPVDQAQVTIGTINGGSF